MRCASAPVTSDRKPRQVGQSPFGTAVQTLVMRSERSWPRIAPLRRSMTPPQVFRRQTSASQCSASEACLGSLRAMRSTALMVEELASRARIGAKHSRIKLRARPREFSFAPGTVLLREWGDREHKVAVTAEGLFEYEGSTFKSLTAVARHITGTHWSGPLFFGLAGKGGAQ